MPAIPLKVQAQACMDAITTLHDLEARGAAPTPAERQQLAAFPGFGCLALDLFPHAVTGQYKDTAWEALGTQLQALLTPEEYASAQRSTYTAFYTPRLVMRALVLGLKHCGVPDDATVLEPGVGIGRFCAVAPATMQFVGIEQDSLSGRICRLLYPQHDIRLEPIQRTQIDPESVDAVVGNVPFSQEKTAYWGRKLSLHELCVARSIDALRPGGILALVVTHYLLDRQQDTFRSLLAQRAALLGAIRLPSDTFAAEGTKVVADLVFLKKRLAPLPDTPAEPWLETFETRVLDDPDQVLVPLNRYFDTHDDMILGTLTRKDRQYPGRESYGVRSRGDLAPALAKAISQLPKAVYAVPLPLFRAVRPRVTPAPVALAEGAFLIEEGRVCQMQGGQVTPVLYGGGPVLTSGTLGTRVAQLIGLRDQARLVLALQTDGAPQAERLSARVQLQQRYLTWLRTYGPINTVVVSEREDGTLVRRLPNLTLFRDDPDAMLVMALEHYDEQTNTATLADIFTQDVVAAETPITQVESAAEALLVVLGTTGRVDVTAMADLYGQPEAVVVEELGDLLFYDPEVRAWETADVYLSGPVKHKLAIAQAACAQDPAYQRNVDALVAVQPPDLPPSAIKAQLGAPWLPRDLIQDFACATFEVPAWRCRVAHQVSEALWSLDADRVAHSSDAARVHYGTSRVSGVTLLQQALNLQMPTVYDPHPTDPTRQVVNESETLAAQDKQQQLKEHFQTWLWQDAQRAERCVRLYNDLRNTHRARAFNGDHLTFPGMSPLVTLTAAQKAAVWRIITTGNTYLGHAVGAGKTFIMLAAGVRMRQLGLIRKPIFVVKNNTLEQFGRMALQLYPQGRFLVAGADDFSKARRKLLTAQMASNQWDGIITTHSALGHLGLSRALVEQHLRDRIARYEALLLEHEREHGKAHHNIRKDLERKKSSFETRLRTLLKTEAKDDGLRFDELGIDALFYDEAHAVRKLEAPTKMQRVAGVQGEGSARAADVALKVEYLRSLRPGHGVVFASATPVCNTLGELFGIQTMLTPEALEESGIAHFDAWAATFGTLTNELELGPDGETLRPRVRLGEYANLPELQQMLTQFMDVQTAAQLALPIPELAGGQRIEVVTPLSPDGERYQAQLVERYGRVRSGTAGRRAEAVLIMGEGRKLGVDVRLVDPQATDWEHNKLRAVAERVAHHWREGMAERTTQLVFCDVGVNPTPWGISGYGLLLQYFLEQGIPQAEMARVDQAKTDLQRHRLFQQVQTGQVRVLIGSTEKMGTGTNVQQRLCALHHVDVPLLPNEIEQREGRILRQGNLHREWGKPVYIYCYGTKGSVEATFWQILQTKAHFIHQLLSGGLTAREAEDVGAQELSFAQMKAIVAGNPALRVLAETEAELRRVSLLQKHDRDQRFQAQWRLKQLPDETDRQRTQLERLQADQQTLKAWDAVQGPRSVTEQVLTLEGQYSPSATVRFSEAEARRVLDAMLEPYVHVKAQQTIRLGTYKGLPWGIATSTWLGAEVWLEGQVTRRVALGRRTRPGVAALHALRELVADTPVRVAQAQHQVAQCAQERRLAEAQLAGPPLLQDYGRELARLRGALEAALAQGGDVSQQPVLCEQITALRERHAHQTPSQGARAEVAPVPMAEAVTTRIMRAWQEQEEEAPQEMAAAD